MKPLVVAVGYDGLATFEFAIVLEVFGLARPELEPDWYAFQVCSVEPGLMKAGGGIDVTINSTLEVIRKAHTVIIPGWRGPGLAVPEPLIVALQEAHRRGVRIVSICTGAFVLAAAGLLSGRQATTHWQHAAALAAADPSIRVLSDVLYVDEGTILTSAGSAAGIDLCLHIVRSDFGADFANHVARRLVVSPHREGGQAQMIGRPVLDLREGSRLSPLLDQLRRRLEGEHTTQSMADSVGMSQRTFIRRFKTLTGSAPGDWLLGERMSRARELLETTTLSMEQITFLCGLGSVVNLRTHFSRRLGTTPSEYRTRFAKPPGFAKPPAGVRPGRSAKTAPKTDSGSPDGSTAHRSPARPAARSGGAVPGRPRPH